MGGGEHCPQESARIKTDHGIALDLMNCARWPGNTSVWDTDRMNDLFDKCDFFLNSPYRMSRADLQLAAELFGDVSPQRNAGPLLDRDGTLTLQFSSNDYLGLAMHPNVRQRRMEVVHEYGICSPMGSRAMTGTTADHLALEREIAAFKRCEAALVFSTGGSATMGALASLASPLDVRTARPIRPHLSGLRLPHQRRHAGVLSAQ